MRIPICYRFSLLSIVCAGILATGASHQAYADTYAWTGTATGGDGVSWHDPLNWTNETQSTTGVPSAGDTVKLNNGVVHISAPVTISGFSNAGTVWIGEGGVLNGETSNTVRYATIHVGNGGVFVAGVNWSSRVNITIYEGGEMSGLGSIGVSDSVTLLINGIYSPRGTSASDQRALTLGSATRWGKVTLGATGVIYLDVYGNNDNEYFDLVGTSALTALTLNQGTIYLRPQEGYVPQVGDTFTLWKIAEGSAAVVNTGDELNIVLPGYALDLSMFAVNGTVTVIPEPGSALLSLGGLLLGAIGLRRRKVAGPSLERVRF